MRTLLVFLFQGVLRDKLPRKLDSATGPQHQTWVTCNATLSTITRQVAEKIAQCNRAFTRSVWSSAFGSYELNTVSKLSKPSEMNVMGEVML